jgi:glucose/arabinose dehydrogenase
VTIVDFGTNRWRSDIDDTAVVDDRIGEQRLLTELNARIRGVAEGPDGALYMLTDGPNGWNGPQNSWRRGTLTNL